LIDFVKQSGHLLDLTFVQRTKLSSMKFAGDLGQVFQDAGAFPREADTVDASIFGVSFSDDNPAGFEFIQEPCHVRVVCGHLMNDLTRRHSLDPSPSKRTQNQILNGCDFGRTQSLFQTSHQSISGSLNI
jgi:hypothetical protein